MTWPSQAAGLFQGRGVWLSLPPSPGGVLRQPLQVSTSAIKAEHRSGSRLALERGLCMVRSIDLKQGKEFGLDDLHGDNRPEADKDHKRAERGQFASHGLVFPRHDHPVVDFDAASLQFRKDLGDTDLAQDLGNLHTGDEILFAGH